MAHFAEINQAPSPNSMLQHIGQVEKLFTILDVWDMSSGFITN